MNQIKQSSKSDLSYSLKCGLASFASTCISVTLLHPLELIKTRFQSHDGQANVKNVVPKYRNILMAFLQIVSNEGFMSLYKGLSVSVASASLAASLFFAIYEKRKKALTQRKGLNKQYETYSVLLAGIQSGLSVSILTQPIWVVKTRMLLNTKKNIKQALNILQTIKQIKQHHGLLGFYKGMSINLLLSFNGALQMLIYQTNKMIYDKIGIPQSNLMEKNFVCGGIAKMGNVLFVYPLTTVRTRIQQSQFVQAHPQQMKYHNIFQIISLTWKMQGFKGFYKGMSANIIRGIPQRGIYFYSYEVFKKLLISEQSH